MAEDPARDVKQRTKHLDIAVCWISPQMAFVFLCPEKPSRSLMNAFQAETAPAQAPTSMNASESDCGSGSVPNLESRALGPSRFITGVMQDEDRWPSRYGASTALDQPQPNFAPRQLQIIGQKRGSGVVRVDI